MADDDLDNDNTTAGDDLEFGKTIRGFGTGQTVLGRFVLERRLGRGGMGVVWLARDEALGDHVALKFVTEAVKNDAGAVDDLKNETRKARQLTHPNIVRIHEFWEDVATAAVSMEFVDGSNLSQLRLDQPQKVFSLATLKPWLKQLCEALDYAYGKAKLVHRDIKPANLMVDADGDLKVADFGISAAISDTTTRVSKMASSGFTEAYSSPQQLRGRRPTQADDLYSLGATLYEMLTGKPPFFRGNLILQVHEEIAPCMAERREEFGLVDLEAIPAAWEETVAACLAKEPEDRPQSAGEVWARLSGRSDGHKEAQKVTKTEKVRTDRRAVRGPRAKVPMMMGVFATVAVLALGGWWFGVEQPKRAELDAQQLAVEQTVSEAQAARLAKEQAEA